MEEGDDRKVRCIRDKRQTLGKALARCGRFEGARGMGNITLDPSVWNLAEPNRRERTSLPKRPQLWVLVWQSMCTETKEIGYGAPTWIQVIELRAVLRRPLQLMRRGCGSLDQLVSYTVP